MTLNKILDTVVWFVTISNIISFNIVCKSNDLYIYAVLYDTLFINTQLQNIILYAIHAIQYYTIYDTIH